MTDKKSAARKIVTRSPQRKVGIINCKWFQDRPIQHESQLEKRFIQRALLCPLVVRIQHQPFTMSLACGKYTPDFLLVFENGDEAIVEVKIGSEVGQYREKFVEVKSVLGARNLQYFVLTEIDVDRDDHPQLAQEILRYAKSQLCSSELKRVLAVMNELPGGVTTVSELMQRSGATREAILHLMARRQLSLHPQDYIDGNARVSIVPADLNVGVAAFEVHFQVRPWEPDWEAAPKAAKRTERVRKKPSIARGPYLRHVPEKPTTLTQHRMAELAGGLPTSRQRSRPSVSAVD